MSGALSEGYWTRRVAKLKEKAGVDPKGPFYSPPQKRPEPARKPPPIKDDPLPRVPPLREAEERKAIVREAEKEERPRLPAGVVKGERTDPVGGDFITRALERGPYRIIPGAELTPEHRLRLEAFCIYHNRIGDMPARGRFAKWKGREPEQAERSPPLTE